MQFKNVSNVRLSIKIPGRKGLVHIIEAGALVSLSKEELAGLAESKYLLDSYLQQVKNEPKVKAVEAEVEEPKAEEPKAESVSDQPKAKKKKKA